MPFNHWHSNRAVTQGPSDEQFLPQLTHLELLSPSQSETKEKLPFSGFYGNSTQEHFLQLFMGLLTVQWILWKRVIQNPSSVQFWEKVQWWGPGQWWSYWAITSQKWFGIYTCSLSCRELCEKINTTLMPKSHQITKEYLMQGIMKPLLQHGTGCTVFMSSSKP